MSVSARGRVLGPLEHRRAQSLGVAGQAPRHARHGRLVQPHPADPALPACLAAGRPEWRGAVCHLTDGTSLFAIAYLAFGATLFGYGAWNRLLSRYPAGTFAPLSLLVPITGLLTATLVLGEKLSMLQWSGCLVVIAGLLVFNYGSRITRGGARSA